MKEITASVITVGTEILFGLILDTNSQFISNALTGIGVRVVLKSSVGDERKKILEMLKYASTKSTLVLITGGLGPTNDDITKKCLSEFFDSPLQMNPGALEEVSAYFAKRGIPLTEINRKQAEMPQLARMITNEMGTAPGMWLEKNGRVFISMPGVPHEMHHMLMTRVIPDIRGKYQTPVIQHKLIMTAGIGESWLAERISGWEKNLPGHISLAYLPGYGQVKLRLTGTSDDAGALQAELNEISNDLGKIIPEYIYGADGLTLEERIGQILTVRQENISLAESCTGGYIGHLLTTVPGSSRYFTGGLIAYHNDIKTGQLAVSEVTLLKYGAVSEETVREMAAGCRKLFNTHYAIATSGIAGPSGGSPEKPVGTIWMAVADESGTVTRKIIIPKDRINTIRYASVASLILFWQRISQKTGTAT
ncbi:MAG: competence/damage-inducible protein A [Cyclobacteriaceae bacterium]|nr:competence/damage-inducible protein A [Cyclobacteriaceae bacterium]